jgi:FMN reductase
MTTRKLKVVALSANSRRPSKTRALVQAIADRYQAIAGGEVAVFDLLDVGLEFAMSTSRDTLTFQALRILELVESADVLIVASPVYKGAYSGHFKHFFDLVEPDRLRHKPVCVVANGGGHKHALVVELSLRPLFGFFCALTLPTAVYAGEVDFQDGVLCGPALLERINDAASEIAYFGALANTSDSLAMEVK